MQFIDEMLRVIAALNAEGVDYILVGGGAMNVHRIVRATEDLDIFVNPTTENVERLKKALRKVWDDPQIDEISAEELIGEYPAVRYGPPVGTLFLDILTRLGEFASYSDLEHEIVMLHDVPVRVATPRTLHWMKRGTVRDIDRADAKTLLESFEFEPRADAPEKPGGDE